MTKEGPNNGEKPWGEPIRRRSAGDIKKLFPKTMQEKEPGRPGIQQHYLSFPLPVPETDKPRVSVSRQEDLRLVTLSAESNTHILRNTEVPYGVPIIAIGKYAGRYPVPPEYGLTPDVDHTKKALHAFHDQGTILFSATEKAGGTDIHTDVHIFELAWEKPGIDLIQRLLQTYQEREGVVRPQIKETGVLDIFGKIRARQAQDARDTYPKFPDSLDKPDINQIAFGPFDARLLFWELDAVNSSSPYAHLTSKQLRDRFPDRTAALEDGFVSIGDAVSLLPVNRNLVPESMILRWVSDTEVYIPTVGSVIRVADWHYAGFDVRLVEAPGRFKGFDQDDVSQDHLSIMVKPRPPRPENSK